MKSKEVPEKETFEEAEDLVDEDEIFEGLASSEDI